LGSDLPTFASEPTSSCSTRPVCSTRLGASSVAKIVGARDRQQRRLLERPQARPGRHDHALVRAERRGQPVADLLHGRTGCDLGDRDGVHEPRDRLGILAAGLRTVHGTMSGVASMARRGRRSHAVGSAR
jgi:hypothetical protein